MSRPPIDESLVSNAFNVIKFQMPSDEYIQKICSMDSVDNLNLNEISAEGYLAIDVRFFVKRGIRDVNTIKNFLERKCETWRICDIRVLPRPRKAVHLD